MYGANYKLTSFVYKNDTHPSGTKLIYNGRCFINGKETELKNKIVTWLYNKDYDVYFSTNEVVYTCPCWEFKNHIVKIINDKPHTFNNSKQKTEIYWTNDMVAKTLWYIVVMLAAVIFYDRIAIWIIATIVWYTSTFKKK